MKRVMQLSTMMGMALVTLAIGCNGSAQPEGGEVTPPPVQAPDAGDAGNEQAPEKPVTPKTPIGSEIVIDSLEDKAYGNVYRSGRAHFQNADDESLLRALIAPDLERGLEMPKETCEMIEVREFAPAQGVRETHVGPKLTLTGAGIDAIPFVDRTAGNGYGYSLQNPPPGPPPATDPPMPPMLRLKAELTPENDSGLDGLDVGTWKGVFETAPALEMKSPDFQKQSGIGFPSAGYRIEYASSSAQLMTVSVGSQYGKKQQLCRLDPSRSDFTIPQALMDAMKAGLSPSEASLYVTVAVYAYVRNEYMQGGKARAMLAVHRRLQQVRIDVK